MTSAADNLAGLWSEYRQTRSIATRNLLVETYLPHLDRIVRNVRKGLAGGEYDDLRSAGVLGLIDAVERFDPTRGVRFSTYSNLRIRGAIIDGLREADWLPRSARRRASRQYDMLRSLAIATGHKPSEDEVNAALGLRPGQYREAHHAGMVQFRSLDGSDRKQADDDRLSEASFIDCGRTDPAAGIADSDEVEHLLANLPPRQQRSVRLRYLECKPFAEAGRMMGISESSACNASRHALHKLRGLVRAA